MSFINPPENPPGNVTHKTFFSQILNTEIGYNIYLPPEYEGTNGEYPVVYHIHGWTGNESSEIWPLEKVCKNRRAITVFINAVSTKPQYSDSLSQIEAILIKELIPHIEGRYRASAVREGRALSGFTVSRNVWFGNRIRGNLSSPI